MRFIQVMKPSFHEFSTHGTIRNRMEFYVEEDMGMQVS